MACQKRRDFLKGFGFLVSGSLLGSSPLFSKNIFNDSYPTELKEKVSKVLSIHSLKDKIAGLRNLEKEYGFNQVKEVVGQQLRIKEMNNWKRIAQRAEKNDMETFVKILWEQFCEAEGIQFKINRSGKEIRIHCTHCPSVKNYKDLNALDWGYELYCKGDYYMIEGFNPNINFTRTKTLMQGHDCCNHTYSML